VRILNLKTVCEKIRTETVSEWYRVITIPTLLEWWTDKEKCFSGTEMKLLRSTAD
jgi:hypothetical protein